MKIEVLLERSANYIYHEDAYVATEDGVFIVTDCNDEVVALYPVRNVSSITFFEY